MSRYVRQGEAQDRRRGWLRAERIRLAQLGAYLDAEFPIDQARELISSGSRRA